LGDALVRLAEAPALRERMGRAGRALVEQRYSLESIVDGHLRLYRRLRRTAD